MPPFKLTYDKRVFDLKSPFSISRSTREQTENVFVKLSGGGHEGYGEAAPNSRYEEDPDSVARFLEQIPEGFFEDVESPEALVEKLDRYAAALGFPCRSAKAAVEMAWLDRWARAQDKPLWELWDIPQEGGPQTSYTIGLGTIEVIQEKVWRAADYPILKVKLGGKDDHKVIKAIREVTDKPIRVDANEGWNLLGDAKEHIAFLADYGIEMVEQPMPAGRHDEMRQLKEFSPIPLCADESFVCSSSLPKLTEGFDAINIKLMKCGSLIKAVGCLHRAKELGMKVMVGCMLESSLANTAGALVAMQADHADLDGHLLIDGDPYEGLILDEDKAISLSDEPGLGVSERAIGN